MSREEATVSERIVENVANATSTDALEQPPLYDVVDPDALDALVEKMDDGEVSFAYAGHQVTVESDGTITLEEQPSGYPTGESATSD